jgi:hypothetical protein
VYWILVSKIEHILHSVYQGYTISLLVLMVGSWLSLWCHLHKTMMCSIFVSVAKQPPIQDEVWEPSCYIYDLCESCSGRWSFLLPDYLCLFYLMVFKAISNIDLIWYWTRKSLGILWISESIVRHCRTHKGTQARLSNLKQLTVCRHEYDLAVSSGLWWEVGLLWRPRDRKRIQEFLSEILQPSQCW